METGIAIDRCGAAFIDAGALVLDRLDGTARITLGVVEATSFAFVDDELWVAARGELHAFARGDGRRVAEPLALPSSVGALIAPRARGTRSAVWGTRWRIERSSRGWATAELEADLRDTVFPTLDRRVLAVRDDRVVVCAESGRALSELIAPPHMKPLSAAVILGGRATAVHACNGGVEVVLVYDWRGRCVRVVPVGAGPYAVAFAEDAALAVLAADRELVAIDLRLGERRTTVPVPFRVGRVAISTDGTSLVVAGRDADGDRPVLHVGSADWWRAPAQAGERPGDAPADDTPADDLDAVDLSDPARDLDDDDTTRPQPVNDAAIAPPAPRRSSPPAAPPREGRERAIADALASAVAHAGLLYERLVFAGRLDGLVPSASSEADPLGGIAIGSDEVTAILASIRRTVQKDAVPDPYAAAVATSRAELRTALGEAVHHGLGLALAVRAFALEDSGLDALILALAPDLDLRFGRVAGFLNNDTTRARPTLGHLAMAAQLGRPGVDAAVHAVLERPGLLECDGDGDAPIAGRHVRVPARLVELLATAIDVSREPVHWEDLAWAPVERERVRRAAVRELSRREAPRLVLVCGAPGAGRMTLARAATTELGVPLVAIGLEPSYEPRDRQRADLLAAGIAHARMVGGALAIRWRQAASDGEQLRALHGRACALGVTCFVIAGAGDTGVVDADVPFVRIDVPTVDPEARRALWLRGFAEHRITATHAVLDDLATRYQLTPGRLAETLVELTQRGEWSPARPLEVEDVRETLGAITAGRLAQLARRHRSRIALDDLTLPESVSSRLAELVARVELRRRVLSAWSFADKTHDGYGVSALFVGPPGTGKTAAAAAIANALRIDLYVVDVSRIMSKWVGETEQNLARVFDEAEASNVALLFDEADALFGKRSVEQKGASDRFANLTINYLLQRMESYAGLVMLTTNLMSAMDAAFQRRITSMVHFPASDEEQRATLWRKLLPAGARFAADVDVRRLARTHVMEPAHIRRALVRAAFRSARRGRPEPVLDARDLEWAAASEYEDMGRIARRDPQPEHQGPS